MKCPGWQRQSPWRDRGGTHHGGQVHVLHPPVLQQHGLQAGHLELRRGRAVHEAQQPVPPAGTERVSASRGEAPGQGGALLGPWESGGTGVSVGNQGAVGWEPQGTLGSAARGMGAPGRFVLCSLLGPQS